MNKLNIVSVKCSLIITWLVLLTSTTSAQLFYTGSPMMTLSTNAKTTSLANANVAVKGALGDYHVNPASIGIDSTFQLYPRVRAFGLDGKLIFAETSFKMSNSAFSLSFKGLDEGVSYDMLPSDPLMINGITGDDIFLNATYAYTFQNGMRAGFGINYLKVSSFSSRYYHQLNGGYYKGVTLDLGLLYEKDLYENEVLSLETGLGFSLTDFGKSPQNSSNERALSQPTTLRLGGSLDFITKDELFNQSLVGLKLMGGVSKIMARSRVVYNEESGYEIIVASPFKALYKSWGSFEYLGSYKTKTSKPLQQVWFQTGLQLTILETMSLRFGYENAAKAENFLDKITFGLGFDLYYISLDYTWLNYINGYAGESFSYENGSHLQLTARVPLDDYQPNSILHEFFK